MRAGGSCKVCRHLAHCYSDTLVDVRAAQIAWHLWVACEVVKLSAAQTRQCASQRYRHTRTPKCCLFIICVVCGVCSRHWTWPDSQTPPTPRTSTGQDSSRRMRARGRQAAAAAACRSSIPSCHHQPVTHPGRALLLLHTRLHCCRCVHTCRSYTAPFPLSTCGHRVGGLPFGWVQLACSSVYTAYQWV